MTSYVVDSEMDRRLLIQAMSKRPTPFTVDITKGRRRSIEQNRLQRLWLNEIAEQLGDRTPEEVRGECKLTLGVPILRAENETFREKYDAIVRPLPYAAKLAIMMEPLDMPVTRLMSTDQKTRYLDAIVRHYGEQGVILTQPASSPSPAEVA
jgi:hypothetical protein